MPRWLTAALLIAGPCFLALFAYDAVAIFVLGRGAYQFVPTHDLARGLMQDFGLTCLHAATVTPRVMRVVADYPDNTRRLCLIMLGLGIAWYDVICASATRLLETPPGFWISVVVLVVIPVVVAPRYVGWVKGKVHEAKPSAPRIS